MDESVASSSNPPDRRRCRFNPNTQPFSYRILRAVRHQLHLLHRADSLFFVLGATGNVYTVTISAAPSCTCRDRITPCKHILFVFIRVLGLPPDNSCLWRRTLHPCRLRRLLGLPTSVEALAGSSVREKFHQLFYGGGGRGWGGRGEEVAAEGGGACPVCLEDIGRGDRVAACGTCKNMIHEECFLAWKRSCGRWATCVFCRAQWRNGAGDDREKYLNLSAYVDEDDRVVQGNIGGCT